MMFSKKNPGGGRFSVRRESDPKVSVSYHHRSAYRIQTSLKRSSFPGWPSLRKPTQGSSLASGVSVDPAIQALVVHSAEEVTEKFRASRSLVQDQEEMDCVARFQPGEIVLGPRLGCGEYSNVYEVRSFRLHPRLPEASNEETERRHHMSRNEKYRKTENARYALKHIKENYYLDNGIDSYVQATRDLALEAELLASLQHPNIIKLRGTPFSGAAGFYEGPSGYFLVIDRLFETLDQWLRTQRAPTRRRRPHRLGRLLSSAMDAAPPDSPEAGERASEEERYDVALQISAALVYLHTHSIMFRDLKPANIGFDVRGDVKIFDFGLARIMPDGDPITDVFDMSGAGTPRYMAPECLSGKAYNLKADVYSFAIIVWEILAGLNPYSFVRGRDQLVRHVVEENGRPDIDEGWPADVRGMLEDSFDSDAIVRPTMSSCYETVRGTLASLRGGDGRSLSDEWITRRRSLLSFKGSEGGC